MLKPVHFQTWVNMTAHSAVLGSPSHGLGQPGSPIQAQQLVEHAPLVVVDPHPDDARRRT